MPVSASQTSENQPADVDAEQLEHDDDGGDPQRATPGP